MNDLVLIPYIFINGQWSIPDDSMKGLYSLMVKEGTDRIVFKSGTVRSEDDFLMASQKEGTHTVVILTPEGRPVAVVWIKDFYISHAYGHFCMFKDFWGKKTIEAGQKAIDYFFGLIKPNGEPLLDLLIGIFPEDNQHALNLIQHLGFTVLGVIPKILYNVYENRKIGAVYSYIERRN